MTEEIAIDIAPWKDDAPFVYSMTYDEGTIDAITNSYPIHEEYGIPGHICQVSGRLGLQRLERGTSMRDVFYLNAEQLRFLIGRGWSVSSHSHTHCPTDQEGIDLDLEVRISKWELEEATGQPVHLFAYWNNLAITDQIVRVAKQSGYIGILTLAYPFNSPDYDVWDIARSTVGRDQERWLEEPSASRYCHTSEAFPGNLTQEKTRGTWMVDITHLVVERLPRANGPGLWNRCVTPAILNARLAEVRDLWGDDVWAAVPEDVVAYTIRRRASSVRCELSGPGRVICTVQVADLPSHLPESPLTFRAKVPWNNGRVNRGEIPSWVSDGFLLWTTPVEDGGQFILEAA